MPAKKRQSVEEILDVWAKQPGAVVSGAERQFIEDMRKSAMCGVGYGWMEQIIDWEWRYKDPSHNPQGESK